jgi:hypothetical protein
VLSKGAGAVQNEKYFHFENINGEYRFAIPLTLHQQETANTSCQCNKQQEGI